MALRPRKTARRAGWAGAVAPGEHAAAPCVRRGLRDAAHHNVNETAWEEKLVRLAAYKAVHGDCGVPASWAEDPSLGNWVKNQRTNKRRLDRGEASNGMTTARAARRRASRRPSRSRRALATRATTRARSATRSGTRAPAPSLATAAAGAATRPTAAARQRARGGGGSYYVPASDAARVDAPTPTRGGARGGTRVLVRGSGFGAAASDDDKESDRGVVPACFVSSAELECIVPHASCGRPGAVALAVSLNGGADFDGGDSSGVPGVLAFEYVASIAVSSLAPRAGPTSGTALHVFGEASRSRPNSRACSAAPRAAAPRAATPPRRPSWARPTQHPAARERSAAAAMRRTPARERLSFVLVVRRTI